MASMVRMSVINTSAGMLSMLAGFVSSIIVARTLGVEGTGMVAFALWFMTVATIISDLGMPQATLRFIARDVEDGTSVSGLFRQLFTRFAVASTAMAVLVAGYALWLEIGGNTQSAWVWLVTAGLFLSYSYSTMSIGAAQGLGQFDRTARRTLLGCLLQPFCVLAGALVLGPAGAILGHATRHLPQALDLRRYLGGRAQATGAISTDIKKYARNNWISGSVLALFGTRIELAIIGFFFALAQVGYYSIGMTMAGMVVQLALFIVAFVVPRFGILHDNSDDEAFARAFEGTIRWLTIVIAPITIGGAAVAPELIPFVFGEDFAPAVWPAILLLAFSLPQALAAVVSRAILAKDRSADELRLTLAWSAVTAVALLATIPMFGVLGAAWVRGFSNVALIVVMAVYCFRVFKLRLPMAAISKSIVSAGLCAAVALAVLNALPGPLGLLLAIAAAAPVYLAALAILRTVPKPELDPLTSAVRVRLGLDGAS